MTVPDFLQTSEPNIITKFLTNPIVKFSYGIMWLLGGLMNWFGQGVTNQLIELEISPLLGIMVSGIQLCLGYYYLSVYYDDFKKGITKILKGDSQ